MDSNILYDLMYKVDSEIKNAESEIMKKSALALSKIDITLENATTVSEIIKFEKQYDEVEKKFEQEILKQKKKIIKSYLTAMEKLVKHLKKKYMQNDFW